MKALLSLFIFSCASFITAYSQIKHDYNWMFGYESPDTTKFAITQINFNASPVEIIKAPYIGINTKIYRSHSTMSDVNGNFIFYTNGCAIYNQEHHVMENGDSINPGKIHDDYCEIQGYPAGQQTSLALPWPDLHGIFILFHQPYEIVSVPPHGFDFIHPILYYSIIDMQQGADGFGRVIEKNKVIVEDTLHSGHVTAVKHANGRDWWVLVPERQSGRYHTLIVTPEGIKDTFPQEIGIPFLKKGEGSGAVSFSPDGSRYMRYTKRDGIHLFDFDRETGMLSNFLHIPGEPDASPFGGAAFSPSGRYLYTTELLAYLYQYDLAAPDIAASKTLVAEYDGFEENNFWPTSFDQMQRGPDCRIYISTGHNTSYFHAINYPDNPAHAVDFVQRAVKLKGKHKGLSIPTFPNYRLDTIPTYPCDSTIVLIPHDPTGVWERAEAAKGELRVWPNPASESFLFTLPSSEGGASGDKLVVFNQLGWEVQSWRIARDLEQIEVDARDWAPGLYYCILFTQDGRFASTSILILK